MTEEWAHKFTDTRVYTGPDYTGPVGLTVEAGLHKLQGNDRPYFSVTGHTYDAAGCLHDYIRAVWPELQPVIALHLSDDTGWPMHAEANSWYQLAGYYGGASEKYHAGNGKRQIWKSDGTFDAYREPTPDECLQSFADYVRIPLDKALELADSWRTGDGPNAFGMTRMYFRNWLERQRPRFKAEADAAIALLDRLISEQEAKRVELAR